MQAKKRRYGLKRLSKEENSRLKLRTEERLILAKVRENLWRRYRGGGAERKNPPLGEGEKEEEAWRRLEEGLQLLDEEEAPWHDQSRRVMFKMKESKLKPVLGATGVGIKETKVH